jgi:hypothetical protein
MTTKQGVTMPLVLTAIIRARFPAVVPAENWVAGLGGVAYPLRAAGFPRPGRGGIRD